MHITRKMSSPVWILITFAFLDLVCCSLFRPMINPLPTMVGSPVSLLCSYEQVKSLIPYNKPMSHILKIRIKKLNTRKRITPKLDIYMKPRDNSLKRTQGPSPETDNVYVQFEGLEFFQKLHDKIGSRDNMAVHAIISPLKCHDIGVYMCSVEGFDMRSPEFKSFLYSRIVYLDTVSHSPILTTTPKMGEFPVGESVTLACRVQGSVDSVVLEYKVRMPGGKRYITLPIDPRQLAKHPDAKVWSEISFLFAIHKIPGDCPGLFYFEHQLNMTYVMRSQSQRKSEIVCMATLITNTSEGHGRLRKAAVETVSRKLDLSQCGMTPRSLCQATQEIQANVRSGPQNGLFLPVFVALIVVSMLYALGLGLLIRTHQKNGGSNKKPRRTSKGAKPKPKKTRFNQDNNQSNQAKENKPRGSNREQEECQTDLFDDASGQSTFDRESNESKINMQTVYIQNPFAF